MKTCNPKSKNAGNPNYICNPKSGVWVKRNGPTGKKILEEERDIISASTVSLSPHILSASTVSLSPKHSKHITIPFSASSSKTIPISPSVSTTIPFSTSSSRTIPISPYDKCWRYKCDPKTGRYILRD